MFQGKNTVLQQVLEAKVIRVDGSVEDRGAIAYWHRNPFKRLAWRLGQYLRGRRAGRFNKQ